MVSQWICTHSTTQFDRFDQAGIQCYQWISTQFDQAGIQCNLNGFPPNLTWLNRSNLTNVRAFESSSQWISTQFDQAGIQCYLNGFATIRPGRHTMLSMDFHPIQPPNLTTRHTM